MEPPLDPESAPTPFLVPLILPIRGKRVILGIDLARLYGMTSKRFHEQVRRNMSRFPSDFCFRLTKEEVMEVAANCGHLRNLLFSRQLPLAFTEHGAIMAASVLNSRQAVDMSVLIVRTFVELKSALAGDHELAHRLDDLEHRVAGHDESLQTLAETLGEMLDSPDSEDRPRIGFRPGGGGSTG